MPTAFDRIVNKAASKRNLVVLLAFERRPTAKSDG